MSLIKSKASFFNLKKILCFGALLTSSFVFAQVSPKGLITDGRIKEVSYNSNQVVKIYGNFGYATTIELERGEYVVNESAFGVNGGWSISSEGHTNKVIVKPVVENATTNLNFSTNKNREYTLLLVPTNIGEYQTYRVRFKYPELNFSRLFNKPSSPSKLIKSFQCKGCSNMRYSFWGDRSIAPIVAKDNGTFTLFKFKKGEPIPAILSVDTKNKKESMVNFHMQEGYVIVEGVYSQYTLRFGEHSTCVFNDKLIKRA